MVSRPILVEDVQRDGITTIRDRAMDGLVIFVVLETLRRMLELVLPEAFAIAIWILVG